MAKVKISDLDVAATLDGTELVELEQDGTSVKCTTQDIADLGGSSYLKYVALLSQSGTDAPVATVLENTLGGTVVWERDGVGAYFGTLVGAFTENKTFIFIQSTGAFSQIAYWDSEDNVQIQTKDSTTAFEDGQLLSASIEIRVYP
jgi:hypothetical protein